jgi:polar amino acid transport system substrate-binding protein
LRIGSTLLAPALAVLVAAGCANVRNAAGAKFEPAKPGVLTVATAFLPQPGFWEGDPPARGFEAQLAADLAHRLGLHRVRVVQVPFATIVGGDLGGADVAISQLTPTKAREHVLDFTSPYLTAPPAVLTPTGVEVADAQALRDLQWVVSLASTLTPIVMDRVRPTTPPIRVVDRTQALSALRYGSADALLLDLPVALGLAHAEPSVYAVPAQLSGDESLAVALPHDSPNQQIVDSMIRAMQADGTIERLQKRWLGQTGENVPLILTET